MSIQWNAELTTIRQLTPTVRQFTFTTPHTFTFIPGQFVTCSFTHQNQKFQRAYSIASPPSLKGTVELCVKFIEGGKGSDYLFSRNPGDTLQVRGPFGKFVIGAKEQPLVFIATGTGISPLRSMIQTLFQKGFSLPVWLFHGVRNESELLYTEEFKQLAAAYPQFTYSLVLSSPSSDYKGDKGHVQYILEKYNPPLNGHYYICGLHAMIESVAALLRNRGTENIFFERYD